jgi:hypothetical protein
MDISWLANESPPPSPMTGPVPGDPSDIAMRPELSYIMAKCDRVPLLWNTAALISADCNAVCR